MSHFCKKINIDKFRVKKWESGFLANLLVYYNIIADTYALYNIYRICARALCTDYTLYSVSSFYTCDRKTKIEREKEKEYLCIDISCLYIYNCMCVYLLLWYANLTTRPRTGLSLPGAAPFKSHIPLRALLYLIHTAEIGVFVYFHVCCDCVCVL